MIRRVFLVGVLFVGACAPTSQDRVNECTRDGLQLYRGGAYEPARDRFRAALALQPGDADLLYNLAQCNDRLGEKTEAERLYNECLHQSPDHAKARHALLVRMVEGGRQADGAKMIHEWLQGRPRLAGPYVEEGWLCARDGDLHSARVRYQRALDLDPRNARAMVELAHVFERLGRRGRAAVLYERALTANPDQPAVRKSLDDLRKSGVSRPHPD